MRYLNAPNTAYGEDRRTYKEGTGGVSASDTVFNVAYDGGRVEAYLNGVRLFPTDDYTKTASGIGSNITLGSAIGAGNVLELVGYQGINAGNNVTEDRFIVGTSSTGSGGSYGGSTTVFNVSSSSGDLVSVWRNGVKLVHTTDFTVDASASTVTLGSAATSADEITIQVVGVLNHAYLITGSGSLSAQDLTDIGNLSGTNTGDQTNISGNAATVTTNANLTGHVTSSGNAASLGSFTVAQLSSALSDASISGNNTGDQTLPTDFVSAASGGTFSGEVVAPTLKLSSNVIKASDGGSTITLDTSDNVTLVGDLNMAINKKIKQKGAFLQSSTHQAIIMGV